MTYLNEYGEEAEDPRDDDSNYCGETMCCYYEPVRRWQNGDVASSRTSAYFSYLIDGKWIRDDGYVANVDKDTGETINPSVYADKHEMVLVLRQNVHPHRAHAVEGRPKSRRGNPYELWWTSEWKPSGPPN